MSRALKEYSLAELAQNPIFKPLMKVEGLDRRSLELIFDDFYRDQRGTDDVPQTIRQLIARTSGPA